MQPSDVSTAQLKQQFFIYYVIVVAALTGLLFGMDTGAIAGALPLITKSFHLHSTTLIGMIVSVLLFGAILGTWLSKPLSHAMGRRFTILVSASLFMICSLVSFVAPNVTVLIIVRFFLGIALGMASFVTPMYLAEISHQKKRGAMIAIYQLMITVGLLLAFLLDTYFAQYGLWRAMLGIIALPAFIMLLLMIPLPRSPRWLALKERSQEALYTLKKMAIESPQDVYNAILENLHPKTKSTNGVRRRRIVGLCALGIGLQMVQQWTGINAIMYYAPSVFQSAGFHTLQQQMWCTVGVGLVNVLTTILSLWLVDRWGRRPILLLGLGVMVVSLLVVAYAMLHSAQGAFYHGLALTAVLTYIFGFAVSLGPIAWIICAEIFPLQHRDFGVTLTTSANWVCNFILAQALPFLVKVMTMKIVFVGFSLMSLLGFVFVLFFIPETKRISLETIEANFRSGKSIRHLGL